MKEQGLKLLLSFETTTSAMAMERACRREGMDGRLIPIPRDLAAGCGMVWRARVSDRSTLVDIANREGIAISGIHEWEL